MILGLTCISEELKLKDKKKYSFRTMTRKDLMILIEMMQSISCQRESCIMQG